MATLSENWFVSGVFDAEYKSYQVLDYIQKTNAQFERKAFFPYFDHLLQNIYNLEQFKWAKQQAERRMSNEYLESLFDLNPEQSKFAAAAEIEEIVEFASRKFSACRKRAILHLSKLHDQLKMQRLGISNPKAQGGLILIDNATETRVYKYTHRLIKRPNTFFQYKDIKTDFARSFQSSELKDYYTIKWEVLKNAGLDGSINTYLVEIDQEIPHFETVLPLVKNKILLTA